MKKIFRKMLAKIRLSRLFNLKCKMTIIENNYEWYNDSYEHLMECILDGYLSEEVQKECEDTAKVYLKELDRLERKMRRLAAKIAKARTKYDKVKDDSSEPYGVSVDLADDSYEPMRHFPE